MFRLFQPVERIGRTNVIWEALSWTGYEHLCLEEWGNGFAADGLIIAVLDDVPSRTWYRIELDESWGFRSLRLAHTIETTSPYDGPIDLNELSRELVRTPDGYWDHDLLDDFPDLSGCTDIDIAITPFTNTLQIRRLNLEVGESTDVEVVCVDVPELTLAPASQRYTRIDNDSYRFESLTSGFSADITVNEQGLVSAYPELFRRIWPDQTP